MEESISLNCSVEESLSKQYNYIVAIDFGNYSTSFSYAHVDYENDIQTIKNWEESGSNNFSGRVVSSLIYKQEDSVPLWGSSANEIFYNENDDFFYVPHIKQYLTDTENQIALPRNLTPIKIVSDYLKQMHEYGVNQMKTYFHMKNTDDEVESIKIVNYENALDKSDSDPFFNVSKDQIRYVFSYPDNQVDGLYKQQIREALEMAGIINPNDPEYRLKFITESEAVGYFCCNRLKGSLKPSLKPYLVCNIGDEILSVSTIHTQELPETATVESHADLTTDNCGTMEMRKKMERYLKDKITASLEDGALLDRIHREMFHFYINEITASFTDEASNANDDYHSISSISNTTTISKLLSEDNFVFSYEDMKSEIFDPVINNIVENIGSQIKRFDNGISGIFLSGAIGESKYLKNLIKNKFGTSDIWVRSIENSEFVVSEGLICFGIREKGLMVPYFESKSIQQKNKIRKLGNKGSASGPSIFDGVKKINHKDIDYIIGIDFGTTFSGFAYAPVPKNEEEKKRSHPSVIKEIKAWPKQRQGNYPKVPSMLYYNHEMKYLNKFGHEAQIESMKRNANGVLLRHFKLLLSRDFKPCVDYKEPRNLNDFEIVDAIAHLLNNLINEGISRMKRTGLSVDKNRLGYVLTIPAMWSDEAKNTMKLAVKKAGIIKNNAHIEERVVFITQAEASALYCEKYFKNEFSMDRQQRFMICNAGGGTVDLTTFEIGREEETDDSLFISELTSGAGDNCGSVYLDENFKRYILDKFESINISYTEKGIENIVDQFVKEIKPNFEPSLNSNLEEDIRLQIPMSLGVPAEFPHSSGFIKDNEIVVPYSDLETYVFKPVVEQVLNLIEKQLRKLPEGERQLDSILVVGGFGQSLYLHKKIIERFENKNIGAVFIGRPPDGDLAKCRGAVSFGLDPRLISEGVTRYTYSLQVKDRFNSQQDDPAQKTIGYDGREYCQNVLTEIVAMGTKINKGNVYVLKTFVIYPNDPIFAIYSTDGNDSCKNLRKIINANYIQPICKLTARMPNIPGIKEGDKVEFEVMIEITSTSINVEILHNGKLLTEKVVSKVDSVISKKKYELGSRGERRKKRRGVSIFSLKG